MNQHYLLFGWHLNSQLPLPCLHGVPSAPADCAIRVLPSTQEAQYTTTKTATLLEYAGLESVWRIADNHWRVEYFYTPENHWIQVNFTDNGRGIEILQTANTTLRNLPTILVSSMIAPFLRQAGRVTLHGGVVNTNQGGVLILGNSGAGKSSTLAALWQSGATVLSDDIAVFAPENPCVAFAGPRYLRIWSDSAKALGIDPETLALVFEPAELGGDKRYIELSQDCPESLEIKRIVILAGREQLDAPKLTRLVPKDAVGHLLQYPFFGLRGIADAIQPQLLEVCVALAHGCAVYLLHTPNSLERLSSIASTILEAPAL